MKSFKRFLSIAICVALMAAYMPVLDIAVFADSIVSVDETMGYADLNAANKGGWISSLTSVAQMRIADGNPQYHQLTDDGTALKSEYITYTFPFGKIAEDAENGTKILTNKYKGVFRFDYKYLLDISYTNKPAPYFFTYLKGNEDAAVLRLAQGNGTFILNATTVSSINDRVDGHTMTDVATGVYKSGSLSLTNKADTDSEISILFDVANGMMYTNKGGVVAEKDNCITYGQTYAARNKKTLKYVSQMVLQGMGRCSPNSTYTNKGIKITSIDPGFTAEENEFMNSLPENLDACFAPGETRENVESDFELPQITGVTWVSASDSVLLNGNAVSLNKKKGAAQPGKIYAEFKVDEIDYKKEYNFTVAPGKNSVKYYDANGDIYKIMQVEDGAKASEISAPAVEHCDFIGWYQKDASEPFDFNTSINEPIELYAKYKHSTYNVYFYSEGNLIDTLTAEYNGTVKGKIPEIPEISGKTGIEWKLRNSEESFTPSTVITGDTYVDAYYRNGVLEKYKVTFVSDGEVFKTESVYSSYTVPKPAETPNKEHYIFRHWEYNGEEFDFSTPIESDMTITAVFEKEAVLVKFYDEDKTTLLYEGKGFYGEPYDDFPENPVTDDYRMLDRWVLPNGESLESGYIITEPVIVYASYVDKKKVILDEDYTQYQAPSQLKNWDLLKTMHTTSKFDVGPMTYQTNTTPYTDLSTQNTATEVSIGATFEGVIDEDKENRTTITTDRFVGTYQVDLEFDAELNAFNYNSVPGYSGSTAAPYYTLSFGAFETPGDATATIARNVYVRMSNTSAFAYNHTTAGNSTLARPDGTKGTIGSMGNGTKHTLHYITDTKNRTLKIWLDEGTTKNITVGPWATGNVNWFNGFNVTAMARMDVGTYMRFTKAKITQLAVDESDKTYQECMDIMYNQLPKKLEVKDDGSLVIPQISGVRWASSNVGIIANDGTVTPTYEDVDVVISATYNSGIYSFKKNYTITVPKKDSTKIVKLDEGFVSESSLINWSFVNPLSSGKYSVNEDGLKITKVTEASDLTTSKKSKTYSAYFDLFGKESGYDSDENSSTYGKEYKGVYDIEIEAAGKVSSVAPASITLGYKNGDKFYAAAGFDYDVNNGHTFSCKLTAETGASELVSSELGAVKKLKIRVNTLTREVWAYDGDFVITQIPYVFYNPFDGDEYKMFNCVRVSLDANNAAGDYILIKNIKVTELEKTDIAEKQLLLDAAKEMGINVVTANPGNLTDSINVLPSSWRGYTVDWRTDTDQIDLQAHKVYQSSSKTNAVVSAYISNGSDSDPCTVKRDFYVTIPLTTDAGKLAEYELSKLGKITNQPYNAITYDLNLPEADGVVWTSSDTSVIGNDGKLNKNILLTSDKAVTITAAKDGQKIEIPVTVKRRAPTETLYETKSSGADGNVKMNINGYKDVKINGNSTLSFTYVKDSNAGTAKIKDSNGKTALEVNFDSKGVSFGYRGSDSELYPLSAAETADISIEVMPSADKAAIWYNGKMVADYVELNNSIDDFASVEITNPDISLKNIKVEAEGYTVLDVNTDNINYFGEIGRNYINASITPIYKSITGADVSWTSGNTDIIADDGILKVPASPSFVEFTLRLTSLSNPNVYKEYNNTLFADCAASRNMLYGASVSINSVPTVTMPKEYAVDNKISTAFEMNGTSTQSRYISMDLGAEKTVNAVYVNAEGIEDYSIAVSVNNSAWTVIKSGTITSDVKTSLINLGEAVTTRYLRLIVEKCGSDAVNIYEIKGYLLGTAEELARIDLNSISLSTTRPTSDIELPAEGTNGTKFTWTSSNTNVITNDGKVTVPTTGTTVILTAAAVGTNETRIFEMYVDGKGGASGPSVIGGGGGGAAGGSSSSIGAATGVIIGDIAPGTTFVGDETVNTEIPKVKGYVDVPANSWYAEAVGKLTEKGIVSGDGSGNFCPDGFVTREQFVKMLVLATGTDLVKADNAFDDVDANSWYADYVLTAKAKGIVNGISDREFGIGTNITRQDMAALVARVLENMGVELDTKSAAFSDDKQISNYAYDAVYAMKNLGLINGYDGAFSPGANLTRAEAAKVINAFMELLERIETENGEKTDA